PGRRSPRRCAASPSCASTCRTRTRTRSSARSSASTAPTPSPPSASSRQRARSSPGRTPSCPRRSSSGCCRPPPADLHPEVEGQLAEAGYVVPGRVVVHHAADEEPVIAEERLRPDADERVEEVLVAELELRHDPLVRDLRGVERRADRSGGAEPEPGAEARVEDVPALPVGHLVLADGDVDLGGEQELGEGAARPGGVEHLGEARGEIEDEQL